MKGSKGKYTAVAKDAKDAGVEMTTLNSLEEGKKEEKEVSSLSFFELMQLLLPYFWPSKGTDGAFMNRLRSTSTWMTVLLSKTCNLAAPFYIASAANDLVAGNFYPAARAMVVYSTLRLLSSFFKEMQSILYIKVKQQATIQLQELTFAHLHSLSLNWHLSKRTGSVMKSMDRGVDAANSLVTYLFLFLIPAIAECLAVSILFFIHFREWQLGMLVVVGVSLYTAVTIVITEWRKKYREATNKHDNDYHDTATDSVINYETVKYFTGEAFEIARFKKSVIAFQQFSSSTAFSLNVLNISQQLILNITMLCAMLVAGRAVVEGRMTLGGWVAIQSWIVQLFAPLNFLGSIYGAIFQAFINIRNLSELLFEQPDISDVPQAPDLPLPQGGFGGFKKGGYDEEEKEERGVTMSPMMHASELGTGTDSTGTGGVSVEFRGISFHYPEQPPEKGLKDVNVLVRPGTTTAVVGHTGAGKTTISRLLFRFYDPHSGSVLINGHDIRQYTQQSVRKAVGIVPQDTVLFNDTIAHNIRYGRLDASFEEVQVSFHPYSALLASLSSLSPPYYIPSHPLLSSSHPHLLPTLPSLLPSS